MPIYLLIPLLFLLAILIYLLIETYAPETGEAQILEEIEANRRLVQAIYNRLHNEHNGLRYELKTLNNQLTQIVLK